MSYKVEAVCPNCRKSYKTVIQFEWKGRGVLRKFCKGCKNMGARRGVKVL